MLARTLLRMTFLPPAIRARLAARLSGKSSTRDIASLVWSLDDADQNVRSASLNSLVASGLPSVKVLIAELGCESSQVRSQIASALGSFAAIPESVVPALKSLLRDSSSSVRSAAANSLGEIGPRASSAAEGLMRLALANEVEPAVAALRALGKTGLDADANIHDLLGQLEHDDRTVRSATAEALGAIYASERFRRQPHEFPEQLTQLLFHREAGIRQAAAEGCAAIGPAAMPALSALIQQSQDSNVGIRRAVATALSRVGPGEPRTFPVLIALTQDKEWTIREIATRGFVPFGPAARNAVPRLKRLLSDEYSKVRRAALEAVTAIGRPARFLTDDLYLRLFDMHEETQRLALAALRELAHCLHDFVPVLIQELNSNDVTRRLTAIAVINEFGDHAAAAMPCLLNCLYDNSHSVREKVAAMTGQPVPLGARR